MGNQPVYRYPPRSHVYNCPCARCVQCRRDRRAGDGLIAFDMAAVAAVLLIAGIGWILSAPLRIWHVIGADGHEHPDAATYAAYGISGGLVVLLLVFFSVRDARKRRSRPPKGRLRVEATTPPAPGPPMTSLPPAAAPACYHLDAVPVDLSTGDRVAWWCEACQTQLREDFGRLARPCCGSDPGTPHVYNCPHRKEWQS